MKEPRFEEIEVAVDGVRGDLRLNRPCRLNALSPRELRGVDGIPLRQWGPTRACHA